MYAKPLQLCLTFCNSVDCNLPGSSVHGILQARILEWVAMPFSRGSSQPRDWIHCLLCLLHWQMHSLQLSHQGIPHSSFSSVQFSSVQFSSVAQSCLTLCDPMDYSLPRSSVHGILQARILEWVAISFSRGSSRPRDQTQVSRIVGRCFTIWTTREALIKGMYIFFLDIMLLHI